MENKEEKPIRSPYIKPKLIPSKEDEVFLQEMALLCAKHKRNNYFFAFSTPTAKEGEVQWKAFSTVLSLSMVECLETIMKGMKDTLKKIT